MPKLKPVPLGKPAWERVGPCPDCGKPMEELRLGEHVLAKRCVACGWLHGSARDVMANEVLILGGVSGR